MISPVKIWRRQKEIRKILGKKGKILTWTRILVAPSDFKKNAPYVVALVELENKQRLVGQLVDYEENHLKINQPVLAILRKTREGGREDLITYGVKFRPIF